MYNNWKTNLNIINCTFAGNLAANGKALACDSYNQLGPSTIELVNCICWDGGDEIFNNDGSTITINYSDVQGGWVGPGGNNIDVDPLFADATGGDFHLQSEAGRFNSMLSGPLWIIDGQSSLCIDAGDPASDVGWEPAGNGGRINMGVYGGANQASRSSNIPGDLDGDGDVDLFDLAILAANWLVGK